ncbi:MAG: carboxylate-amine ligase [Solirubrobacteraceae bacterium]
MSDQTESAFGSHPAFTIGIEEELFLVDPSSGRQVNSAEALLTRMGETEGSIERELHACMAESITSVCRTAGEAIAQLSRQRARIRGTGAGLLGSGTHPAAGEGEAEITDKERYERIHELLGDAVATPVAGLHVHVGMPDGDTAIRVFNGLRGHLPLLQALGANSPFRHGRDTGLASAREVTMRGWPRAGALRAMRDFEDFLATAARLAQAAEVPDYTWFWWKLRPHPRLGTVEIRALDAQTTLAELASLAALVHCLARHLASAPEAPGPAAELLDEGAFRAARYGVAGRLPDEHGRLRPVEELLAALIVPLREHAQDLGCSEELDGLDELLARGGGAGRQRALHEIAGPDSLLRELTGLTGP